MSDSKEETDFDRAWKYYEKIKGALDGLFEILTINFNEDDLFYQVGVDNLEHLKETIIDLLKNDYNSAEIKRKLRDLEFNMKKNLFFEEKKEDNSKSKS